MSACHVPLCQWPGKYQGFRSSPSRYEYVEAALDGLASGRVVLTPNEENELLYAKFENPMLGMIGAYAYILRGQIDYHRLGVISGNLLELLPNSPDARLLAILASSPSHDQLLDPCYSAGFRVNSMHRRCSRQATTGLSSVLLKI